MRFFNLKKKPKIVNPDNLAFKFGEGKSYNVTVLKTDPRVFNDIWNGHQKCEIRLNDRNYQVGDTILSCETMYTGEEMKAGQPLVYTGRRTLERITHVLSGYGLEAGWVVLSVEVLQYLPPEPIKANTKESWLIHSHGLGLFGKVENPK